MVKAREKSISAPLGRIFGGKTLSRRDFLEPLRIASPSDTLDPLLLPVGARVAVLSPDEGATAQFYALKKPDWRFFSWLSDAKAMVRVQSRLTELPNLFFDREPEAGGAGQVDAVIAAGVAHQVFSRENYSLPALAAWMRKILAHLPEYGQLLIQDIALPEEAERFILLDVAEASAASGLEVFAEKSRPQFPKELQGFFIEKLDAPRAGVARYRLPYRAAAEFFHRWRFGIAPDAPFELTTLSAEQWAALAESANARAVYRAPHPVAGDEAEALKNIFTFWGEDGSALSLPPASFTLLVEKLPVRAPVAYYERRPSAAPPKTIALSTVRKKQWAEIADKTDDVLVWRLDEAGRLRVWLRFGVARPVVNTVPRGTPNLDGRRWAGYLIEPLAYPATEGRPPFDLVTDMLHDLLGLPIAAVKEVRAGLRYYPAPDNVAQRVRGIFVKVNQALPPCDVIEDGINQGRVVEVLADDVLRALGAGLIGDGKLEILIGKLLHDLGLKSSESGGFLNRADLAPFLEKTKEPPRRENPQLKDAAAFEDHLADKAGSLRAVRSTFVADHVTASGRGALQIAEHDFLMHEGLSANIAVCVPLMRNMAGQFLIGTQPRQFDVPQRMGDTAALAALLSFRLPFSVKTLDDAREFLAEKLDLPPDHIAVMGPSFFVNPVLSPERAWPFIVRANEKIHDLVQWYRPKSLLPRLLEPPVEKTAAYVEFAAARALGEWAAGFTPEVTQNLVRQQAAKARNNNMPAPVASKKPVPEVT